MEATHFVAGPWFTVEETGGPWKDLDGIVLSHGDRYETGRVEIRMRLEETNYEG